MPPGEREALGAWESLNHECSKVSTEPPHQHLIRELPKLGMQLTPAASFLLASLRVRGFLARDQPEDGWEAVGGRCWRC